MSNDLDERFEAARAADDRDALARLFAEAASVQADPRGRAFMLTQAHALGLEGGLPDAEAWRGELVRLGAEPSRG